MNPEFVLHDGPPYANGDLHMGHLLNKVVKDIINRTALLRGKRVSYVPGWDCHGLPIELKALREIRGSEHAEPMEIRERARKCAEDAIASQRSDMIRWGVFADWNDDDASTLIEREYHTMQPEYEAQQLRLFSKLVRRIIPIARHTRVLQQQGLEYTHRYVMDLLREDFDLSTGHPHLEVHSRKRSWSTTRNTNLRLYTCPFNSHHQRFMMKIREKK